MLTTPERALDMAEASEARLKRDAGGTLEGIPLGIKDLFCTKGVRTTACSHILDGFTPTYESTVTANLWAAGAVMLNGGTEVEVRLPGRFKVSPQIAGAIKAVPGVVAVEAA